MLNKINPSNPTDNLAVDANGLNSLREAARQNGNSPEAIKGAAKQFEALFLNMMMKSMRDATPHNSPFDNEQTKMFTSMLDQQMSQNLAQRGIGLADVLTRQLSASLPKKLPDAQDLELQQQQLEDGLPMNIPLVREMSEADRAKFIQSFANQQAADPDGQGRNKQRRSSSSKPAHVEAFQNRLQADAEIASKMTGIPAKFMLAQAALETGWGKKEIVTRDGRSAHNLFGIKATGNWTGKVVEATTIEYINGKPQKRVEKFRAYDSYADAFRDYANLLRSNPRYEKVLASAQDAHGFAYGLQRAGYATDPHYAEKLSRIIRQSLSA
ncbi:flagellar assembly peptidoglycan hydrolase FlgJ [Herbaspirillum sp.]|uniref:flagellar assembly peptidoglycan hydrolase FlgJ n=1 Tax=Herbaspirillum sp. TaxID=1890675 RepID=UPI001B0B291E|nr:flagellar assembly peptidoglycan hydrolase FlgJ [Herbaspirillum sp.]MBO9535845.1 flagellar assembly peptidoglycan hydrolase FlgJ [Herbaspirillum sp.]